MSEIFTTIIIADSRGRGLENFVSNHPTPANVQVVIDIRPGKSLAQLTPSIIETINNYDLDKIYCIVSAGICGLTDKVNNRGKKALRYKNVYRDDKVACIIDTAKFLKHSYGDKINICSIIPANLVKYFQFHNSDSTIPDYLIAEQLALEEDITAINKVLLELNSVTITNINLSSRFQAKSKKKRQKSGTKAIYRRVVKYKYTELIDGVHLSDKFKSLIFTLIINTAIRDTNTTPPDTQPKEPHRQQTRPVGFRNLRIVIDNTSSTDNASSSDSDS